jgi:hypothetical protein
VHLKYYRQKNCRAEQDSQDDIKKPFHTEVLSIYAGLDRL